MRISYEVNVSLGEAQAVLIDPEHNDFHEYIGKGEFHHALDYLWEGIAGLDAFIAEHEPFKLVKTNPEKAKEVVAYAILKLYDIAGLLEPFMPETSEEIQKILKENGKPLPLFKRVE
jgi:methionyl-tRNA synthetase